MPVFVFCPLFFFFFHSLVAVARDFSPREYLQPETNERLAKLGVSFVIYKPGRPSAIALRIEISIRQNDKTGLERSRWINIAF